MIDDRYTAEDLRGTLRALATRWRWLLEALDDAERAAVEPMLAATAAVVGAAEPTLDAIHAAAIALDRDAQRDAVESSERLLSDAGRAAPTRPQSGVVAGLFASGGGVPKSPIDVAEVGRRGVDGDRQATRKHHGRVSQALCLWSAEVIEALAAEGHPIAPGNAGENVLVRGIDWSALRPGVRLHLGADVVAEVSGWALPCAKNARWFADGDFRRIDPDLRPGSSRAYASVLGGGVVRTGDAVLTS